MGAYDQDQPLGTPPTYYESTSRTNGAAPLAASGSGSGSAQPAPFVTSGGWVPPSGSWQPSSHAEASGSSHTNSYQSNGYASSSLAPPRASTSSDHSDDGGRDEKRSSGLFGSRKKDKSRAKEKDDHHGGGAGSSSSSFVAPPPPSSSSNSNSRKGRTPAPKTDEENLRAYLSRIPSTAQKALAPLAISSDNKDILGIYSIELSNSTSFVPASNGSSIQVSPTASFESTSRNDIDITLYLRPNPEVLKQQQEAARYRTTTNTNPFTQQPPPLPARNMGNVPLEILAKNKKGRIKLSIPDRYPGRALRVICTLESHVNMQLPQGFSGKLAIWAPAGSIELSESLRQNSTIIPSTTGNTQVVVYKITPASSGTVSEAETAGEQAGTMDLCQLNTSKGRVKVEYARAPKGQQGGDCLVM